MNVGQVSPDSRSYGVSHGVVTPLSSFNNESLPAQLQRASNSSHILATPASAETRPEMTATATAALLIVATLHKISTTSPKSLLREALQAASKGKEPIPIKGAEIIYAGPGVWGYQPVSPASSESHDPFASASGESHAKEMYTRQDSMDKMESQFVDLAKYSNVMAEQMEGIKDFVPPTLDDLDSESDFEEANRALIETVNVRHNDFLLQQADEGGGNGKR